MPRSCHVLRVFTRNGGGGNHLGVITDLVGLTPDDMQAIAAELGYSETVFIDWPTGEAPFVRIFTPSVELPFAGHPLVGTAWAMLSLGPGGVDTLRCGIGSVAVGLDDATAWVEAAIDAANARLGDHSDYARRAGLPTPLRSWAVAIPRDYIILEYPDADTIASVTPEADVLAEEYGTLVFARTGDRVRARFFAPGNGIYEDPATGSAAVALATALMADGEHTGSLIIDQGEEIGFPSRIAVSWTSDSARIGGTCVRDDVLLLET